MLFLQKSGAPLSRSIPATSTKQPFPTPSQLESSHSHDDDSFAADTLHPEVEAQGGKDDVKSVSAISIAPSAEEEGAMVGQESDAELDQETEPDHDESLDKNEEDVEEESADQIIESENLEENEDDNQITPEEVSKSEASEVQPATTRATKPSKEHRAQSQQVQQFYVVIIMGHYYSLYGLLSAC